MFEQFFCAKLSQLDHIDYDQSNNVEYPSSIDENPLSMQEQIDNIHTHQNNVFNTKLKHLMQEFQVLLEPLNDLPPSRPNFTLEIQELKRQLQVYL